MTMETRWNPKNHEKYVSPSSFPFFHFVTLPEKKKKTLVASSWKETEFMISSVFPPFWQGCSYSIALSTKKAHASGARWNWIIFLDLSALGRSNVGKKGRKTASYSGEIKACYTSYTNLSAKFYILLNEPNLLILPLINLIHVTTRWRLINFYWFFSTFSIRKWRQASPQKLQFPFSIPASGIPITNIVWRCL